MKTNVGGIDFLSVLFFLSKGPLPGVILLAWFLCVSLLKLFFFVTGIGRKVMLAAGLEIWLRIKLCAEILFRTKCIKHYHSFLYISLAYPFCIFHDHINYCIFHNHVHFCVFHDHTHFYVKVISSLVFLSNGSTVYSLQFI